MKSLITFLLLAGSIAQAKDAPPPGSKPNIVFILADDLGYADAGFMGSKEIVTPNLDKLAHAGAVLKSLYVQSVCSPTRAALLTGRYATRTGVYNIVSPNAKWGLPLEERTLADALREAGYETAICGKWHLGEFDPSYLPTRRGFDHQYGLWFGMVDFFTHKRGKTADWHKDDKPCAEEGYSTHLIAKEACRLIRDKKAGKPLFLYVPFNAVHTPMQVPPKYLEPFASLKGDRKLYAGMAAAMDEGVGEIVDALREKGIFDNTLIVFASDNGGYKPGEMSSNDPLRDGKGTLYEGGIRSCAFASWPGHIPGGQVINEPLHIVDWYPTLVKLAGGSLEQKLPVDGLNIWPVLTAKAKSPHDAIFIPGRAPNQCVMRQGDWKLLKDGKRYELYNLAEDGAETTDLAGKHPDILKKLQTILNKWLASAVPAGDLPAKGKK